MKTQSIILVGGGGHCKSCIDVINATNNYKIAGILDVKEKVGQTILGIPVIGTDADIPELIGQYDFFLITIGQIQSSNIRRKLFDLLKINGAQMPMIISPNAYVSPTAVVAEGTIIHHGATVNAGATIGVNCIINSHALIEHDTHIGNHVHVSTGAICNGEVEIGDGVFIGSNAILIQGVKVGQSALIGAGSVVLSEVDSMAKVAGNPAKKIS